MHPHVLRDARSSIRSRAESVPARALATRGLHRARARLGHARGARGIHGGTTRCAAGGDGDVEQRGHQAGGEVAGMGVAAVCHCTPWALELDHHLIAAPERNRRPCRPCDAGMCGEQPLHEELLSPAAEAFRAGFVLEERRGVPRQALLPGRAGRVSPDPRAESAPGGPRCATGRRGLIAWRLRTRISGRLTPQLLLLCSAPQPTWPQRTDKTGGSRPSTWPAGSWRPEARRFYGDTLGCSKGRSAPDWVDFNIYGHQLVCHLNPQLSPPSASTCALQYRRRPWRAVPHCGVVLEPAARLRAHEVEWVIEPTHARQGPPGASSPRSFIRDPFGQRAFEFKSLRRPRAAVRRRCRAGAALGATSPAAQCCKGQRRLRSSPPSAAGAAGAQRPPRAASPSAYHTAVESPVVRTAPRATSVALIGTKPPRRRRS